MVKNNSVDIYLNAITVVIYVKVLIILINMYFITHTKIWKIILKSLIMHVMIQFVLKKIL